MPKIILSEFVEPDLATIWDYIALDNTDAADRVIEAVYHTFEELRRMPGIGQARPFSASAPPRVALIPRQRVHQLSRFLQPDSWWNRGVPRAPRGAGP